MDFYFLFQKYVFDNEREQRVFIIAVKQLQVIIFYDYFCGDLGLRLKKKNILVINIFNNFYLFLKVYIFIYFYFRYLYILFFYRYLVYLYFYYF